MNPFRIDVHLHGCDAALMRRVEELLSIINIRGARMAQELDDLKVNVANNTTVIGSAITLLQGLKAKLDTAIASGDPAALTALSTELGAQDQALAAAITANTPA